MKKKMLFPAVVHAFILLFTLFCGWYHEFSFFSISFSYLSSYFFKETFINERLSLECKIFRLCLDQLSDVGETNRSNMQKSLNPYKN